MTGPSARKALLALPCLLAVASASPARATGQGLSVAVLPPASEGKGRALVEVTDPALQAETRSAGADRWKAIPGKGEAQVAGVSRFGARGEARQVVLAFDQSGSFGAFWQQAVDLARAFSAQRPRTTVRAVTFGLKLDDRGAAPPGSLDALLDALKQERPSQAATRLKSFIRDAARLAAQAEPMAKGGLRDVVVFTDAGEESGSYSLTDLVTEARALGVRVHTVVFYRKAGATLAQRMDDMKRLAELTGGRYVQVDDLPTARSELDRVARGDENLYWLDLTFCGLGATGHFDDTLSVELNKGGSRLAWTGPTSFRQHAAGPGQAPCRPCDPPCQAGTTCVAGTCTAIAQPPGDPTSGNQPGLNQPLLPPDQQGGPKGGTQAAPPPEQGLFEQLGWKIPAAVLAGLGLLLLLALLGRRKAAPAPQPIPAPPPVAQPPPLMPLPPEPVAQPAGPPVNPLASAELPETRLVLSAPVPGLASFYRVTKSSFTVGREGEVDLRLDVPQVSSHHLTFELVKTGRLFVRNEMPTNGTFVDGRRLADRERVAVQHGQTVWLSKVVGLRIEQPGLQPAQPAPAPLPIAMAPPPPSPAPQPPPQPEPDRRKAKTIYEPVKPGGK